MRIRDLLVPLAVGLLVGRGFCQEEAGSSDPFAAKWPRVAAWVDATSESDAGYGVAIVDAEGRTWVRVRGRHSGGESIEVDQAISIGGWSRRLWRPALQLVSRTDAADAADESWLRRTLSEVCGIEALESVGMECLRSTTVEDLIENRIRFDIGYGGLVRSSGDRRPISEILRTNVHPVGRWTASGGRRTTDMDAVGAIVQWVVETVSGESYTTFLSERVAPGFDGKLRFFAASETSYVGDWAAARNARSRGESAPVPVLAETLPTNGLAVPLTCLPGLVEVVRSGNSMKYRTPTGEIAVFSDDNYAGVAVGEVKGLRFAFVGDQEVKGPWPEGVEHLVADLLGTDDVDRGDDEAFGGGWNSAVGLGGGAGSRYARRTAYGPERRRDILFWPGRFDVVGMPESLGSYFRVRFETDPAEVIVDGKRIACRTTWPRGLGLSAVLSFERGESEFELRFFPMRLEQGAFLVQRRSMRGYSGYRAFRVRLTEVSGEGVDIDDFERVVQRTTSRMATLASEFDESSPAQIVGISFGGQSRVFAQGSLDGAAKQPVTEDTVLPFGGLTRALTQRLDRLSGHGIGSWIDAMNTSLPGRYEHLELDHGGELLRYLVPFDRRVAPNATKRSVEQILQAHLWPVWDERANPNGSDLGCAIHQRICELNGRVHKGAAETLASDARKELPGTSFRSLDEAPSAELFRFLLPNGEFVARSRREVEFAGGVAGTPSDLLSLAVGLGDSVDVGNEARFFGGNWSGDVLDSSLGVRRVEYRDSGVAWTTRIVDYPTLGLSWFVFLAHSDESFADDLERELVSSALGDWDYDLQLGDGIPKPARSGIPWRIEGPVTIDGQPRAVRIEADFGDSSEVVVRLGAEILRLRGRALGPYRFEAESPDGVTPKLRVEGSRSIFRRAHDIVIYIDRDGFGALPYGGVLRAVRE